LERITSRKPDTDPPAPVNAANFEEYEFSDAENFFGTVVVIEDSAVIFVAPTHTRGAVSAPWPRQIDYIQFTGIPA